MSIFGASILSVLAAIIAGFAIGAVWYGVLGRLWARAAGLTEEQISRLPTVPMLMAFTFNAILAFLLSFFLRELHGAGYGVEETMTLAMTIALGFVFPAIAVNYAFQQRPTALTFIDGGHWVAVLATQALMLGWLNA